MKQNVESIGEMVKVIVKKLVDRPDEVKISYVFGDYTSIINIYVPKKERGKVIGKKGVHMNAIRTLVIAASGKLGTRIILELIEG